MLLLSARDNFTRPVGGLSVGGLLSKEASAPLPQDGGNPPGGDPYPHCRLLVWSPDDSLLAAASSDGTVLVLDARARLLHTLPPTLWAAIDPDEHAPTCAPLASVAFRAARANSGEGEDGGGAQVGGPREGGFGWELLLLTCDGVLHRWDLPPASASASLALRPCVSRPTHDSQYIPPAHSCPPPALSPPQSSPSPKLALPVVV